MPSMYFSGRNIGSRLYGPNISTYPESTNRVIPIGIKFHLLVVVCMVSIERRSETAKGI